MEQANKKESRLPILRQRLNELLGDMSTTDFAKKIGISRQTMGFYLNGDRIPDAATLRQICTVCDISADWLLGRTDDPTRSPCATDDLGLSVSAVSFISKFWKEGKDMEQDWIEEKGNIPDGWISGHTALNMLLDNPLMGIVFAQIAIAKSKASMYSNMTPPDIIGLLGAKRSELGERAYNYHASRIILHQIIDSYPEIAGYIHITYGTDSLKKDIDEICEGFRLCVEEITGYKNLIEQLDSKKR